MLFIARRVGVLQDGHQETVIVNDRWEIAIEDKQVETGIPRLRLKALKHAEPYVFTVSVKDKHKGETKLYHLYMRYLDDHDDRANIIVLNHHGHNLEIGIARVRGNHVRLGFQGKPGVFRIKRNESQSD